MIASFKTLFAIFAATAAVSARVVPRKSPPKGWWTEGLEDYNAYHTRYLALDCQNFHGQEFFDQCCHPLKKDETLETARPPQCIPSASASASASLAEPTSTVTTPDDEPPTSVTSSAAGPASSSSVTNVGTVGDSDDGDEEDCDDGDDGDDSSSVDSPSTTTAPSSTKAPAPELTSTRTSIHASSSKSSSKESNTKTSSAAKSSSTSSSSGQLISGGFATFYFQNGNQGACGDANPDTALIAAIDSRRYGNTGEKSSLCGRKVKITNTENNKQVTVTIADACPTCENQNSIDLSTGAFDQIADRSEGMVPISWEFD